MKIFTPSLRSLLFAVLLFFARIIVSAAPHNGTEMLLKQPDGSSVKVKVFGDEYYQRIESVDGYTLIRNSKGWICYASSSIDKENFISTDIIYKGNVASKIKNFPILQKGIKLSTNAIIKKRLQNKTLLEKNAPPLKPKTKYTRNNARGTTVDNVKGLAIIIDFADEPGTVSRDAIERYFNSPGYNEFYNNGSVRDYYLEVSGGLLDYSNVVTNYYRAKFPKSYYDCSTPYGKTSELLQEAFEWLDQQGFDFSTLSTQDGEVRAVNFYYAGYPTQGWTYGLWPHMSYYSFETNDGVRTGRYQITNIGSSLTLATTCHENGHMVMGWPDLYDYGYDGFSSAGLGSYCLMAYQGASNNPVPPNAHLRNIAGWEDVTNITNYVGQITLSSNSYHSFRYDNASNPNEYFIIESRTKTGRSASLPDEGLMIWHVDQGGYNEYQDMTSDRHFMVSLEQADGLFELERGYSYGASGDLFSAPNKTSFNDFTLPDATWWSGLRSNLSINNISAVGNTMTANIGAAASLISAPTNLVASVEGGAFKLTWQDNANDESGFKIERKYNTDAYQLVGTVDANVTSFLDNNNLYYNGVYTYRVYAYSASSASPYSNEVTIQQTQAPYGGYPASVLSVIEAENFDTGGEGIAYHDVDANNIPMQYRNEGVDIENCSEGGYSVGYIRTDEWLEYTIEVPVTDYYEISIRVASDNTTGKFHLEFDGQDKTGIITVPPTGGWQNWTTLKTTAYLIAGTQVMRLYADGYDFNVNNFSFNNKPRVAITSPDTNASFTSPANIQLTADAVDANGVIDRVEFYANGTSIGTVTAYPYTLNWSIGSPGTFTVVAKAYDTQNAVTDSAPVSISVNTTASNNIALNKPVTTSSTESGALAGNYAVDGNGSTRWSSAFSDPQYFIVDLGSTFSINQIKISWETAYAQSYQIQFSTDNINWTTVKDISNNNAVINDFTLSGTARYVKMYGITRATPYGYSIYEFEVYGTPVATQVNLAYNKPFVTSADEATTYIGGKAVDGDGNTRWSSTFSEPHFIAIDLGAMYNISTVKLSWEVAYAKYFQVQVSNDNATWTTVKDVNNNTSTQHNFTGLNAIGRYVKINCINRATPYGFSIYELEVYGTPAPSATHLPESNSLASHETKGPIIYPQPAHDVLKIKVDDGTKRTIASLQNTIAQTVASKASDGDELILDTKDLAEGIYILSIKTDKASFNKRIVISR